MNTQPKSKLLLLIIGILLVTNVLLIGFLLFNKPVPKKGIRGDRYAAIAAFLKNDIGFNQPQLQQYDSLNAKHSIKIRLMFDSARKNKDNQLIQLGSAHFADTAINNEAQSSANSQKQIEVVILSHFKDIRGICTPLQQPVFDSTFYKVFAGKNGDKKMGPGR